MIGSQTDYVSSGGGAGFGFGGGFGSAFAGSLIGSIFSRMFNNFGNGNFGACNAELAELQNQMANMRHDISEDSYKNVSNMLNQTMSLMKEMSDGRYENAKNAWQSMAELQECCCQTQQTILNAKYDLDKSILIQGFENQLRSKDVERQIVDSACKTDLLVERTAHATQIRDMDCCCETNKKLEKIEAEIRFQGQETRCHFDRKFDCDKIERLEREIASMRESGNRHAIVCELKNEIQRGTRANINITKDFWNVDADATPKPTFADTYPF